MTAGAVHGMPDEEIAIFNVNTDYLDLTAGYDGVGTWNYNGTIPPYRLKLL
jgi:hypothetical protein